MVNLPVIFTGNPSSGISTYIELIEKTLGKQHEHCVIRYYNNNLDNIFKNIYTKKTRTCICHIKNNSEYQYNEFDMWNDIISSVKNVLGPKIIIVTNISELCIGCEDDVLIVNFPRSFNDHPDAKKPNEYLKDYDMKIKIESWYCDFMLLLLDYCKNI